MAEKKEGMQQPENIKEARNGRCSKLIEQSSLELTETEVEAEG